MKARFWGLLTSRPDGAPEFVMLANSRGSSSCRRFDARTGALISYKTSGARVDYDVAYGSIYQECSEMTVPHDIATSQLVAGLPERYLLYLQEQAGVEASAGPAVKPLPIGHGMLAGTREMIDEALGPDIAYETKTAAQRLSESPVQLDSAELLDRLYDRIVRNWDRSECRSTQLWRERAMPNIAAHNDSPEKTLEKAIVESAPGWFNQIPAAAGLLKGIDEKHRNVDLGHFLTSGHLELIELKAGLHADTALKAAFEIVGYGLLYCFARAHRVPLMLPRTSRVLDARRVDLKVLAPKQVYAGYNFKWLDTSLSAAFRQFSKRRFTGALEMDFRFEAFPDYFEWPGTPHGQIPTFLERRTPVTWT